MALARYESVAVNLAGDVIPNATVEVRRDQPGRPVVPLWADREGTVALGNPITTDAEGKFGFHVVGGSYYIRVFTGPSQQPLQQYARRYQAIGTAAERDVEDLASALEAGTATFPTLAALEAFTPTVEGVGGKVTTGEDAGFYHYDTVEEEWVFDRPLFDTLARMNVTGGTADAIEAEIVSGVDSASVVMLFIEPTGTNTGPVTINGTPVLNTNEEELSAGQWVEGRTYWFSDETTHYKLRTDSDVSDLVAQAETAAAAAIAAQAAAEAAAAGAGVTDGDKGDVIVSAAGTVWTVPTLAGDSGTGGAKGLAPAPSPGDSAGGKFLKADGTWAKPTGASTALLVMAMSEFVETYISTGDLFGDGYGSLGMVNVAGATNLDSSEAGYLKPSLAEGVSFVVAPAGNATDLTTYTFSSQSLGAAAADRRIIVAIQTRANAARSISSVTIGGVAATSLTVANDASGGADIAALYIALVPTGTTGDVVVTMSAAMLRMQVAIWRMVGASSSTPSSTLTTTTKTGNAYSSTINCPAGGVIIAASMQSLSASASAMTWAGVTEDYDTTLETASFGVSGAHQSFSAAQTGLTVSATNSGTLANGGLVAASFALSGGALDLTVASETIPCGGEPSSISGNLRVIPTDALTLNTDLFFDVTRDGSTWHEVALALKFTDGGVSVLEFGPVDLSSDPSGSVPRWRIRSDNGKNFKVDGVALEFIE